MPASLRGERDSQAQAMAVFWSRYIRVLNQPSVNKAEMAECRFCALHLAIRRHCAWSGDPVALGL